MPTLCHLRKTRLGECWSTLNYCILQATSEAYLLCLNLLGVNSGNPDEGEHACGYVFRDWTWADADCLSTYPFICETITNTGKTIKN